MPVKLRVLTSSGNTAYPPTEPISVNSTTATKIKTELFDGEISVWVKGFQGDGVGGDGHEYFDQRSGMTYSIVVKGKYLDDPNADEVIFGNVFEGPIRDSLPWGTSVAVKFMNYIDPTLDLDIYADKPWALSPALASMTSLSLSNGAHSGVVVKEDSVDKLKEQDEHLDGGADEKAQIAARRKWLAAKENRTKVSLKGVHVGMEFANGLLDFNTLSATLPQPFHLSIPLLKYWNGLPVTYVCRRRQADGQSPVSPEGVYWTVGFEIIDEDAKKALEERGGKVLPLGQSAGDKPVEVKTPAPAETKEEISDDVD